MFQILYFSRCGLKNLFRIVMNNKIQHLKGVANNIF